MPNHLARIKCLACNSVVMPEQVDRACDTGVACNTWQSTVLWLTTYAVGDGGGKIIFKSKGNGGGQDEGDRRLVGDAASVWS